jgi:hypothetical protein
MRTPSCGQHGDQARPVEVVDIAAAVVDDPFVADIDELVAPPEGGLTDDLS